MVQNSSYRSGVGIVICNDRNQYFLARRVNQTIEAWQMPQGGIEEGESFLQAMQRELYEETGIKSYHILQQTQDCLKYDLPLEIRSSVWDGQYRGQQQKWFLIRFTGDVQEINLHVTLQPEFDQWKWATPLEILEKVISFKKDLYKNVFKEFHIPVS